MSMYVYVSVYICVCLCLSLCVYVLLSLCVGICVSVHVCVSVSVCMSAFMDTCISVYVYLCMPMFKNANVDDTIDTYFTLFHLKWIPLRCMNPLGQIVMIRVLSIFSPTNPWSQCSLLDWQTTAPSP